MLLQNSIFIKLTKYLILLLSIVVHLFLLFAISDLYFTNHPNDNVEVIESSSSEPLAKRIVLFVADGLNYETLFNSHLYGSLFISNFTTHPGTFGIAKARFPTTERAGHLALLSGTYEDPVKAILNSLLRAEVTVDSLVNRTSQIWFWGKPSVIDIYTKENKLKLHKAEYKLSAERSNSWIVSNIKEFLPNNRVSTNSKPSEAETFFLFHMPLSAFTTSTIEKYAAIKTLDNQIEQIVSYLNKMYWDNSTAFFVTSAYGLTDWGSHGGDSEAEVNTPVLAWGAGIKINKNNVNMKQIDLASLIACLISVSIPKHSLGILPVDYLNLPRSQYVTDQAFNAIQLSRILVAKKYLFDKMHYVKFHKKLPAFKGLDHEGLTDRLANIHFHILYSNPVEAMLEIRSLISDLFEGLSYYETFYNVKLIYCVIVGHIFWIIYIFGYTVLKISARFLCVRLPIALLLIPLFFSLIKAWHNIFYNVYLAFPFVMIWLATPYVYTILVKGPRILINNKWFSSLCFIHLQLLCLATIYRQIVSLQILLIGLSVYIPNIYEKPLPKKAEFMWPCCCISLALASLLNRLQPTICSGALLIYGFCIWLYILRKCQRKIYSELADLNIDPQLDFTVLSFQIICFSLAAFYKVYNTFLLARYKIVPWLMVTVPLVLIIFSTKLPAIRMVNLLFGIVPFYFLTAVSDEMIFLLIFVATVYCWGNIETDFDSQIGEMGIRSFMEELDTVNDKHLFTRRIYVTSVLVFAAFYGAGNVFNINSYSVWGFDCLVPSSAYILSALVVLMKISTPIIIYFAILHACNKKCKVSTFDMVCLLTVAFDVVILEMIILLDFRQSIWLQIDITQIITMTGLTLLAILSYLLVDIFNIISCIL